MLSVDHHGVSKSLFSNVGRWPRRPTRSWSGRRSAPRRGGRSQKHTGQCASSRTRDGTRNGRSWRENGACQTRANPCLIQTVCWTPSRWIGCIPGRAWGHGTRMLLAGPGPAAGHIRGATPQGGSAHPCGSRPAGHGLVGSTAVPSLLLRLAAVVRPVI